MRFVLLTLALTLTSFWLDVTPADAAVWHQGPMQDSQASSSSEAARIAQDRFGGQVLKVKAQGEGKTRKYKVRLLLDDGRVKEVTIQGQ